MGFHKTVSGRAPEKKDTDDLYEHRHPFSGYKWLETPREYRTLVKATAMEFVGTAVFIFLAIGSVTSGCQTKDVKAASGNAGDTSVAEVVPGSCFLQSTTLLNIALSFGLSLFIVIYFTASFSGHINPAVSLAMFITKRISLLRFAIYTIFQCAGAAVASIILKGLNPVGYKAAAGAANQLNAEAGATIGVALGYEIILTFVLVFVVFAATDTKRALMTAPLPVLAPLSIGITVFAIHLVGVPIDGCCVNPARGFGAAAVARVWSDYWIFWVGPFVGAVIAAVLYEAAFKTRRIDRSESDKQQEADVETGIPVASNTSAAVHSGVAGLAE